MIPPIYLATTGLTDVGRTYYASGVAIGSRSESGITEVRDGWYQLTNNESPPSTAQEIYWDSAGDAGIYAWQDVRSIVVDSAFAASLISVAATLQAQIDDLKKNLDADPEYIGSIVQAKGVLVGVPIYQLRAMVSKIIARMTNGYFTSLSGGGKSQSKAFEDAKSTLAEAQYALGLATGQRRVTRVAYDVSRCYR